MKFSDLELHPKVLSAVVDAGYETPTPIQEQAIPHALQRRDVLGIAQTGTGKTASFTLPMLTLLAKGRARARMPRSLILAPTRELAAQVAENFETYGKNLRLTMALLIGGVSFNEQEKLIDRGVDVLIATPGRLIDHFERGKLMLTGIEIMVVDEADRMLDMGFIEDIEKIFKLTPFTRQTLFFSATMPPEITRLTNEFLSNPVRVEVARASSTVDTIEQRLCRVPTALRDRAEREKRRALRALIDQEQDTLQNAIIFCNRKRDVATLFKSLTKHGYDVGALHGDLDQSVRTQVLDGFRNGGIKILVASDVAARGLDIPGVSHVFNFDVPLHAEDYVHRIGRTGRAGRKGVAYTLCAPADGKLLARVEELIKQPIPPIELAGVTDADPNAAPPESEARDSRGAGQERGAREDRGAKEDRGARRLRGGRRRRGEAEPEAASREPVEAAETVDDAERRRSRRPRRDARDERPARDERQSRDERPARDERQARDERPAREGGQQGRYGRDTRDARAERDAPVFGLGEHVPAFLLREVRLPSFKDSADAGDTAETGAATLERDSSRDAA